MKRRKLSKSEPRRTRTGITGRVRAGSLSVECLEPRQMLTGGAYLDLNSATNFAETGDTDRAYDVAIQSDGKMLVSGISGKNFLQEGQDLMLARYNADGSVDTNFNGVGYNTVDFGVASRDYGIALAIQNDGKIVVVGHGDDYSDNHKNSMIVARFNENGSLDATFSQLPYEKTGANDVLILPSGKILVLSAVKNFGETNDVMLTRLNDDLTLDTSFGSGGMIVHDFLAVGNTGYAMAQQSDGKILVAGGGNGGQSYFVRFNADGTPDSSYPEGNLDLSGSGESGHFEDLVLDVNDNAYFTGPATVVSGTDSEIVVVKLDSAGDLVTSFGVGGVFRYNMTSDLDEAFGIAIDSNGKLVLAGRTGSGSSEDGVVVRVNADGTLDTSFANNGSIVVDVAGDHDELRSVAVDASNRPVAVGEAQNFGNIDTWLLRVDPMREFYDSFEYGEWNGLWVEDGQNDWFTSTQRSVDGGYSAEVDGSATDATLTIADSIDMTAYGSAELTFSWLIENGFDSGEYLALDFKDDNGGWNEILRLDGNIDQENIWHNELVQLDPQYLHDSFAFRYRAKVSGSSEDANLDNVQLRGASLADPPNVVSGDDAYSTNEDAQRIVDAATGVLVNDSDVEGDPLTAAVVSGPTNGTLILNTDGSFSYTPDADFFGSDGFTYQASDGTHVSSPAEVTITVAPVNDAPVAVADSYSASADTSLNVASPGVLSNDLDVDGDPLNAVPWTGASDNDGQVTVNSDGSFSYTPPAGFTGADTFNYTNTDGVLDGNSVQVSIDVTDSNTNALYVSDIRFESKHGGRDWRVVVEIRSDSNADGQAGPDDQVLAGVEVTVTFGGQTFSGTTDSNGVIRGGWIRNLSSGDHYANVVDLLLTDYSWDPLDLDLENDSDGDGKPDDLLAI